MEAERRKHQGQEPGRPQFESKAEEGRELGIWRTERGKEEERVGLRPKQEREGPPLPAVLVPSIVSDPLIPSGPPQLNCSECSLVDSKLMVVIDCPSSEDQPTATHNVFLLMVLVVWLLSHMLLAELGSVSAGADEQPTATHYAFLLMVLIDCPSSVTGLESSGTPAILRPDSDSGSNGSATGFKVEAPAPLDQFSKKVECFVDGCNSACSGMGAGPLYADILVPMASLMLMQWFRRLLSVYPGSVVWI
ncbi:hypothetical protein Nepgr_033850 [Nepenthes gracilis]|uniref:Uncharacterized protein n=1 Tax=Nepenthes gracilis TaxID=150966 RepID=A0AAD3TMK8_NEPGR|nr:hypothetical protein Nepgr_033850 [Nepenthes gracilis]